MKKPELGVVPKDIWYSRNKEEGIAMPRSVLRKRLIDLGDCFIRRVKNEDSLLEEWLVEYNELLEYFEREGI